MNLLWLLVVAWISMIPPRPTYACGGLFCEPARPVIQSGEAIAFGVEGNTVTMHVQILYEGPAEKFSWVLPVPFQPQISVGSDVMFQSLFTQTLPQFILEINNEASATCSNDALQNNVDCDVTTAESLPRGDVIILDSGSVGPFDFVVLEAAENDPTSVFRWLDDNGYDQYDGSAELINYYAVYDHKFVAVKLNKDSETGEIQPLILTYDMPSDERTTTQEQIARRAIACVPIQLTRVAAADNMPIQVYILGEARAVPLNFMELELDDTQVDWLGCLNNPSCYFFDYRARFDSAASLWTNHTFVTEYAGSSAIMAQSITIDITAEEIASLTEEEFNQIIRGALPDLTLVNTIVDKHTTNGFDAAGLAQELDEKVLKPAIEAQAFVDKHAYLTRLYGKLSPQQMTKDPFFAFKPELPPVDNVHRATAVPICTDDDQPSGLAITLEGGNSSFVIPARIGCSGWEPSDPPVIVTTPIRQLASWGFAGDPGMIILPSEDGSFDRQAIQAAVLYGDSLVMNQTIPEYSYKGSSPEGSSPGHTSSTGRVALSAAVTAVASTLTLLV